MENEQLMALYEKEEVEVANRASVAIWEKGIPEESDMIKGAARMEREHSESTTNLSVLGKVYDNIYFKSNDKVTLLG